MKKWVLILTILLLPAIASAQSQSIADLFYPTYGYAEHWDGINEYLGYDAMAPDGISWNQLTAGEITTFSIIVSVGDFWGVGDFYNLAVWADWDGNRFFDTAERIIDVSEEYFDLGVSLLTFDVLVPVNAYIAGSTWLRARLDWYGDGALASTGSIFSGEIEDYEVNIAPVPEPATIILLGIGLAGTAIASRRKKK